MASYADVHQVSLDIGALSNGVRAMFKVPTGFGGISVVAANVVGSAAGTTALNLVDLGTGGSAVSGTIATLGSSVYVANVPKAFTVSTAYVGAGHWVGVEEANVAAAPTITVVNVSYITGK